MTPLRITELAVSGFRNLANARFTPDPRANVLIGSNGQGKTSLLEAIDYVASLRSFRGATRAQVIAHESDEARVFMRVEGAASVHEYRLRLARTSREVLFDSKRPERALNYFGGASCVVFQPGDLELVRGAPEGRRRLLDRILVRVVDGYGEALKNYARALRARNQLLRDRNPHARAVQAYDFPLARYGAVLVRAREAVVPDLVKAAQQSLDEVALTDNTVSITYRARAPGDQVAYASLLAGQIQNDLARRSTQLGPHADDLVITWGGRAARIVASQGQTRALALALRLAELHVIEMRARVTPVLLLDDVSSELDQARTERLFALVARLGAQSWVTTTDPTIAGLIPRAKHFSLRDGSITSA